MLLLQLLLSCLQSDDLRSNNRQISGPVFWRGQQLLERCNYSFRRRRSLHCAGVFSLAPAHALCRRTVPRTLTSLQRPTERTKRNGTDQIYSGAAIGSVGRASGCKTPEDFSPLARSLSLSQHTLRVCLYSLAPAMLASTWSRRPRCLRRANELRRRRAARTC